MNEVAPPDLRAAAHERDAAAADRPNLLRHGDMAAVCRGLEEGVLFDLVYLDPPFAVGDVMTAREHRGEARGRKQPHSGRLAYRDQAGPGELVAMLEAGLALVRERMHQHAALFLHMDHRAVHEAKMAADRVFGRDAFAGEAVWSPGNGARGRRFSVTHQTILLYGRGGRHELVWRSDHPLLREPYAETSLRMHFRQIDADGRRYRERVIRGKHYRYYADEGRRLGSVWTDIPAMAANTPIHKEGTGYPTQKPEKLLERIVRAASQQGDTVCDLMCGSGTTLAVAARLGRRFVGGDQSTVAIEHTRRRLDAAGIDYHFAAASREASRSAATMGRHEAAAGLSAKS